MTNGEWERRYGVSMTAKNDNFGLCGNTWRLSLRDTNHKIIALSVSLMISLVLLWFPLFFFISFF